MLWKLSTRQRHCKDIVILQYVSFCEWIQTSVSRRGNEAVRVAEPCMRDLEVIQPDANLYRLPSFSFPP